MLPLINAPVEKLTEPRECPFAATIPLKLVSCEWTEVMPAFEIAMLPNRLVRVIPSAKAVSGKASANTIRSNAAFICESPGFKLTAISHDPRRAKAVLSATKLHVYASLGHTYVL
jgi:hypothetical protein